MTKLSRIAAAALAILAVLAAVFYLYRQAHKEKPKPAPKTVRRLFQPSDISLDFPFGSFGACSVVAKGKVLNPGVYCRKDGNPDHELLALKFFLPESWHVKGKKLNQENVAVKIAMERPKDAEIGWSFQAPETGGKRKQFFLALTSVDEKNGDGQLQVIIVGEMRKAVYSLTYTKIFTDKRDKVRDAMKKWLTKNIEAYGPQIALIDPDPAWLNIVRGKTKIKAKLK